MNKIYKALTVFMISINILQTSAVHAMLPRVTTAARSYQAHALMHKQTAVKRVPQFSQSYATDNSRTARHKQPSDKKYESDKREYRDQKRDAHINLHALYNKYAPGAAVALGVATSIYGLHKEQKKQAPKEQEIAAQKEQEKNEIKERVEEKIENRDSSFVDDIITCLEKDIDASWLKTLDKKYYINKLILDYFSGTESYLQWIGITPASAEKREEQCAFLANNIVKLYEQGIEEIIFYPMYMYHDIIPKKVKTMLAHALEDNFAALVAINHTSYVLKWTLTDEALSNCLIKNFDVIYKQQNGPAIIDDLAAFCGMQNDSVFIDKYIEHITNTNTHVVATALTILQDHPCHATVIQKIKTSHLDKNDLFARFLLQKIAQCTDCNATDALPATSQTEYHLNALSDADNRYVMYPVLPYTSHPELKNMFSSLHSKEQELAKKGYVTFVHGQRWEYQFAEDLFTHLWQLNTNKSAKDFVFAHVKDPAIFADCAKEEAIYTNAIQNGRHDGFGATDNNRQRLLFLNYVFFGNTLDTGSCTASYIANNRNVGKVKLNTKEIFNYFNNSHLYETYQAEFNELQKQHKKLTDYGNCFLIAVPQEQLDQSIIAVKPSGYKRNIKPSEAVARLKAGTEPFRKIDNIEFCLPMTNSRYGGLNPESGIKIFDFNAVPQQEWKEYMKKRNALFAKIARDIRTSQPSSFDSWYEHIV